MLNLAMTCLRALDHHEPAARAATRGDVDEALRLTEAGASSPAAGIERYAVLGQLRGRLLIAASCDEEAEEVFQQQHVYGALPRAMARWLAALDRGVLELTQKRLGRAAEQFKAVADDEATPAGLRVEALAGLALALHGVGDARRVQSSLGFALRLAESPGLESRPGVLVAIQLDLDARTFLRQPQPEPTSGGGASHQRPGAAALQTAICRARAALNGLPLLANRLGLLAALLSPEHGPGGIASEIRGALSTLRKARLGACEEAARIDAVLACVALSKTDLAEELLAPIVADEPRLERPRHAIDLTLCFSHVHAARGRHAEALRLYRRHTEMALHRLRRELPLLPYSRFLEKDATAAAAVDASELCLPKRYRKAYRFIIEQLGDCELSIRQIAAHIDMTERALQMTFRVHLGMTPAEVVRRRRMEHIRSELLRRGGSETVLDVASRWGVPSRSTFTQNYRQQFGEAPSSTLRRD